MLVHINDQPELPMEEGPIGLVGYSFRLKILKIIKKLFTERFVRQLENSHNKSLLKLNVFPRVMDFVL
jgi:hypothetical protein